MKYRLKLPGTSAFVMSAGVSSLLFLAAGYAANPDPIVQDDRNYQGIQNTGKSRIPNDLPEWTDMKPSDPGTTILDTNGAAKIGDISTDRKSPAVNKLPPIKSRKASKNKAQPSTK